MNGDRDMLHVTRSEIMRSSPSPALRKSANGCSPSKLPVCKSSLFSSPISKGQSMYSGRRGTRSSISETLLLAANGERKRLVGGKTPTKQSAILTFPSVVEDGVRDDQLDSSQSKPKNVVEEMKETIGCSFSDDRLYEHVPDMLQQPTCSEKVSKWLEESQHSTMTAVTDNHTVSSDEEYEVNRRETGSVGTRVAEVCDNHDRNLLADILSESNPTAQKPDEVRVDKFKGFRGLLMGYLKVIMCLSVVYIGLLLRMRPTSWNEYEPPPT